LGSRSDCDKYGRVIEVEAVEVLSVGGGVGDVVSTVAAVPSVFIQSRGGCAGDGEGGWKGVMGGIVVGMGGGCGGWDKERSRYGRVENTKGAVGDFKIDVPEAVAVSGIAGVVLAEENDSVGGRVG
jgi:hypothetical protein